MLHLAHKISGAAVRGTDGDIGTIEDFYFEEDRWTVRYLLVDTGKWFSGKRVLDLADVGHVASGEERACR